MTNKQVKQFNNMLTVLRGISNGFSTPGQLRRECGSRYGLEYEETLEMSYENIQMVARGAARGVRPIKEVS